MQSPRQPSDPYPSGNDRLAVIATHTDDVAPARVAQAMAVPKQGKANPIRAQVPASRKLHCSTGERVGATSSVCINPPIPITEGHTMSKSEHCDHCCHPDHPAVATISHWTDGTETVFRCCKRCLPAMSEYATVTMDAAITPQTNDVWSAVSVHTMRPLDDYHRRFMARMARNGEAMHSRRFSMYVPAWDTRCMHGPVSATCTPAGEDVLSAMWARVDRLPDNGEGSAFHLASESAWEIADDYRRASEGDESVIAEFVSPYDNLADIMALCLHKAEKVAAEASA